MLYTLHVLFLILAPELTGEGRASVFNCIITLQKILPVGLYSMSSTGNFCHRLYGLLFCTIIVLGGITVLKDYKKLEEMILPTSSTPEIPSYFGNYRISCINAKQQYLTNLNT